MMSGVVFELRQSSLLFLAPRCPPLDGPSSEPSARPFPWEEELYCPLFPIAGDIL